MEPLRRRLQPSTPDQSRYRLRKRSPLYSDRHQTTRQVRSEGHVYHHEWHGSRLPVEKWFCMESPALVGNAVRMTDSGAGESAVAWTAKKVSVGTFTPNFTFQLPTSTADGFFHHSGRSEGHMGNWRKCGRPGLYRHHQERGDRFAMYGNSTKGAVSQTGLVENGAAPSTQSIDMSASKVSLHSGHILFGLPLSI